MTVATNAPTVVSRQYYKPYGEIAWSNGNGLTSYNYTGQRLDGESGLLYYGARYYDPALSFFVSPDSTVPDPKKSGDLNRYLYVVSNPLRHTDPTGNAYKDHYVIVYGCLTPENASECSSDLSKHGMGEFDELLHLMFKSWVGVNYTDELWASWRASHVHAVPTMTSPNGARNLERTLAGIQGDVSIHIWSHSAGGTAVLQYLEEKYWHKGTTKPIDPRIASVAMIDSPLAPLRGYTAAFGRPNLATWLTQNTRIREGGVLQVRVQNSVVWEGCIEGFACRTADYSRRGDNPGLPHDQPLDIEARAAWHAYSYRALKETNLSDWFFTFWH